MGAPLLVVVGPTAVGKTAVLLELAPRLDGEVVSADSMQVYRGLDVGTAKPSPAERQRVPHHLIDVADPGERFTVARYQRLARQAIAEIHRRGKLPILSGGTGLYIQAVLEPLLFPDEGEDLELRARLAREAEEQGPEALYRRLAQVDPEAAQRLAPRDLRRVIRALEVYERTGRPITELQREARQQAAPAYRTLKIGLTRPRPKLYARIEARVDQQLANGLVDEARRLLERVRAAGASRAGEKTALQALAYKELFPYLEGQESLEQAVERLKRATRRYAKRQLTWFRRDPEIHWIDLEAYPDPARAAEVLERLVRDRLLGSDHHQSGGDRDGSYHRSPS
ncbi:tRNA (adenosine(37)-N6)-dimethylallyltransferase MiaA [Limnochorda sp.]|uniref:tRNA (adenosine(37)-N6)-dimethylallyltransferase MiaA n=1 Tax=Limnochorda sp. TaxID=1940279 RepID=UPI001DEDB825|nr:tRNA (adenosine(37)-N6)-dimethylallyltransferase MiaA [Bacillota bacterium]MBO2518887.1 tRNA (adenosine(37)-N6)-dimethylallyltransferase MiaA [Bacillota bacterium]